MISGDEFLHMVGLDGYMLLRFLAICLKLSCFIMFWGLVLLVPLYGNANGGFGAWNKYTLANVVDGDVDGYMGQKLWVPAIFSYIFMAYACHLFYMEYKHFVLKRLEYLIQGDPDTAPQTHYTIMLENVPIALQSAPALKDFFEKLFPGDVFAVEVMLDLKQLETLCEERRKIRNQLEKAIALWNATGKRPTILLSRSYYLSIKEDMENVCRGSSVGGIDISERAKQHLSAIREEIETPRDSTMIENSDTKPSDISTQFFSQGMLDYGTVCGYIKVDSIQHHSYILSRENETVRQLQQEFLRNTRKNDAIQSEKLKRLHPESRVSNMIEYIQTKSAESLVNARKNLTQRIVSPFADKRRKSGWLPSDLTSPLHSPASSPEESPEMSKCASSEFSSRDPETPQKTKSDNGVLDVGKRIVGDAASLAGNSFNEFASESVRTARVAGKGAIRGVLEATRTLELLTLGAYYSTSSTAFVTFKSRVSKSVAYQMLLSHEYFEMNVKPAPNTKDILWENVSTPQSQVSARHQIAGMVFGIMAVFWSAVVASINAYSNLDNLAEDYSWLQAYQDSLVYKLLNQYLAVMVLLILLAVLPFIFDFTSRFYEGLKCESEIQDLIMTRYFYYQLANVYVTVTAGTIIGGIHDILDNPGSILTILGESLPQVSIYFANLLIVKTLTAVPFEMLRVWPLLTIIGVKTCFDKKKFTRRELRSGVFEDYQICYGWIYPNLLMVLMILTTYMCIAPLLVPFGALFFAFAYLMYKYQLLYVYVNEYQSGGNMWYQVFNRSMIIFICASLVLLGYLGLKKAFYSGPFYLMFPLPFLLAYFWDFCNRKFKTPSAAMSLECAVEIDELNSELKKYNQETAADAFNVNLFRQPSLSEESLKPERYRNPNTVDMSSRTGKSFRDSTDGPSDGGGYVGAYVAPRPSGDGVLLSTLSTCQNSETSTSRRGGGDIESNESLDPGQRDSSRLSAQYTPSLEEIDDEMVENQIDELLGGAGNSSRHMEEKCPILQ